MSRPVAARTWDLAALLPALRAQETVPRTQLRVVPVIQAAMAPLTRTIHPPVSVKVVAWIGEVTGWMSPSTYNATILVRWQTTDKDSILGDRRLQLWLCSTRT